MIARPTGDAAVADPVATAGIVGTGAAAVAVAAAMRGALTEVGAAAMKDRDCWGLAC